MSIDLLKTFRAAIECGSYLDAAAKLGLEHSTVSRKIAKLEGLVGTALISTSPRGMQLTHEGELLYDELTSVVDAHDGLLEKVRTDHQSLKGPLNVLVGPRIGSWLSTYLQEFKEKYPEIDLCLFTDDRQNILFPSTISGTTVGLVSYEAPKKSPFIWEFFGCRKLFAYAHEDYLKKHGEPKMLEDLDHHQIIRYQWGIAYDHLDHVASNPLLYAGRKTNEPRPHYLTTDDILHCRDFVESGLGIGMLPPHLAKNLKQVLNEAPELEEKLSCPHWFVCPLHLKNNVRVQAFKEFIMGKSENFM